MSVLKQKEVRLPLERLFGTANARVMDFLLEHDGLKYSESEISAIAGVPPRTLQKSLQLLLKEDMIKRSKNGGRVYDYTANLTSPRVAGLLEYVNATVISNFEAILKNAKRKAPSTTGRKNRR